nr:hypothetical protein [Tanacetum cinerariifolium]
MFHVLGRIVPSMDRSLYAPSPAPLLPRKVLTTLVLTSHPLLRDWRHYCARSRRSSNRPRLSCSSSLLLTTSTAVVRYVRDPMNPWAYKEEMLLADAIAANISHAEKKKKCRIVCRTHGVGSAHHARSDGVPISVPTVVPQGLAILLADAATQTEPEEAT